MLRQTALTGTKHECYFSQRFMRGFSPVRSPIREAPQDVIHERFSYLVLRRKGSFNLSLPPNTDETDEPPLQRKVKVRPVEEPKTPEELEYEAQFAAIEQEEMQKLLALSKDELKQMFAFKRPVRVSFSFSSSFVPSFSCAVFLALGYLANASRGGGTG